MWWGRAGKVAQFVAGLTIVLDLIGPERFIATAERLKFRSDPDFRPLPKSRFLDLYAYVPTFIIVVWMLLVPPVSLALQLFGVVRIDAFLFSWFGLKPHGADSLGDWILAGGLYIAVYILVLLVLDLLRLSTYYLLLIPRAALWLVSRSLSLGRDADPKQWDRHPIRWLALLIAVFGFHWDLLAS